MKTDESGPGVAEIIAMQNALRQPPTVAITGCPACGLAHVGSGDAGWGCVSALAVEIVRLLRRVAALESAAHE